MSLIELSLSEVPHHIYTSQFVQGLIELSGNTDGKTPLIIPKNVYCHTLIINTNADLAKIVEADTYFGFSQEIRIEILKNVHNFWLNTEYPIEIPQKGTILGDSIYELFNTSDHRLIHSCMKNGLVELYLYCQQSTNPAYKIMGSTQTYRYGHSILLSALENKHYELFKIAYLYELERISNEDRENFMIHAIDNSNYEIIDLLINTKTKITENIMRATLHNADDIISKNELNKCKMLQKLYNNGGPLYNNYAYRAAMAGCQTCLQFIIDEADDDKIEIIQHYKLLEAAVRGKNLECYRFIHECLEAESALPERLPLIEAVANNADTIFHYLVEAGAPVLPICIDVSIQNKSTKLPPQYLMKFCKGTI